MPDFWNCVRTVFGVDEPDKGKSLGVGTEFRIERIVREIVHECQIEKSIVQRGNAEQHVAVAVPGVEPHSGGFELCGSLGKPERLQGERHDNRCVLCRAFVVVVDVGKLCTVDEMRQLAAAFDARQMGKFVGDDIGDPGVRAANLEIPVRKKEIHRVFVWHRRAVCIQGVLKRHVDLERHLEPVSRNDGIVHRFCRRGDDSRMGAVACRIGVVEMLGRSRLPADIALVARKGQFRCEEKAGERQKRKDVVRSNHDFPIYKLTVSTRIRFLKCGDCCLEVISA